MKFRMWAHLELKHVFLQEDQRQPHALLPTSGQRRALYSGRDLGHVLLCQWSGPAIRVHVGLVSGRDAFLRSAAAGPGLRTWQRLGRVLALGIGPDEFLRSVAAGPGHALGSAREAGRGGGLRPPAVFDVPFPHTYSAFCIAARSAFCALLA